MRAKGRRQRAARSCQAWDRRRQEATHLIQALAEDADRQYPGRQVFSL
jgi:hypothetical protein